MNSFSPIHSDSSPYLLTLLAKNKTFLPGRTQTFRRNEYLFRPHQTIRSVYLPIRGRVKVGTFGGEHREIIKKVVGPGGIIGESVLIGRDQSRDYALAMEETKVYSFSKEEIIGLVRQNPSFYFSLLQRIGDHLLEIEQRLEQLVFKDSRSRVIHFLDQLASKQGQRVGYEILVRQFFTHREIAHQTATSRQTVTMVLNELRNKNILTFNRRRLLVRDLELLRAEYQSVES